MQPETPQTPQNSYVSKMREQYPNNANLDDVTLAKIVRAKHFPDETESDFLTHIGLQEKTNAAPKKEVAFEPFVKEEVPAPVEKEPNVLVQALRQEYDMYEHLDDYALAKLAKAKHQPEMDDVEYYGHLGLDDKFKAEVDKADTEKKVRIAENRPTVNTGIDFIDKNLVNDFTLGAAKNVLDYSASAIKGVGKMGGALGFDEFEAKSKVAQAKFNKASERADKAIDNEYVALAGEMIADPINLAPAGIFAQGAKAARVAKSMAGGAVVGGATMAAKNYGDDTMTQEEKNAEMGIGAGFVSALNGIIAGVTKGRVTSAINDVPDLEAMRKNPEAYGVTPEEAEQVAVTAQEHLKATKQPKASEELGLTAQQPVVQPTELDQIDNGFKALADEILPNKEDEILPRGMNEPKNELFGNPEQLQSNPLQPEQITPKVELSKQQQLLNAEAEAARNLRIAEYRKSIDKPMEASVFETQAQNSLDEAQRLRDEMAQETPTPIIQKPRIGEPEPEAVVKDNLITDNAVSHTELLQHPRLEELLMQQQDVLAKDNRSPNKLLQTGAGRELSGNGGTSKHAYDAARYEKNSGYDFMLTKQDVKNIRAGNINANIAAKLENDLGVYDNHPEWNKQPETAMSADDWAEANVLFSKGADNLAVGAFAGIEQDENGNLTFDAEKFVLGLGGYTAVKAALKNKQVQGKLKEYAQKAVDIVDMNPQVHKESGFNAMFVGAKGDEVGAFSDTATKQTMKEIDDSGAKYNPIPKQKVEFDGREFEQNYANLGEIINHEELFKQYPNLKDVQVSINNKSGSGAAYNPAINSISIDRGLLENVTNESVEKIKNDINELVRNPLDQEYSKLIEEIQAPNKTDDEYMKLSAAIDETATGKELDKLGEQLLKEKNSMKQDSVKLSKSGQEVLLHEVQHAVQNKEGWATGGSPQSASADILKKRKELVEPLYAERKTYFKNGELIKDFNELNKLDIEIAKLESKAVHTEEAQKSYMSLSGEQQARATAYRANMTPKQRASESMWDTLKREEGNVPDSIVKYGDGVAEHAKVLEDKYLDKNGRVLESKLIADASDLPKPMNKSAFAKQFSTSKEVTLKTPTGDVSFNVANVYKHFTDNTYFNDRYWLTGAFKDALENPLFVVNNPIKKQIEYYKPFKDAKGLVHYVGIIKGEDGNFRQITAFDKDAKQIEAMMKGTEGNLLYYKGKPPVTQESVINTSTTQSMSKEKEASKEIVPQTKEEWNKNLTEWHKDSSPLTKNEDGTPKVFYHGTMTDFSEFKNTGSKVNGSRSGEGFYFTADVRKANSYAKKGKDGNVMPVYLNAKNIYKGIEQLTPGQKQIYLNTEKPTNEILQELGFDARAMDDKEIVIFEPTQIKSINNRGTFDSNNPNILMANGSNAFGGGLGGGLIGGMEDTDGNYIPDSWNWRNASIGALAGMGVGHFAKGEGTGMFGGKAFTTTYNKFKAGKLPNATALPDET
ncbi:MAG: hypothetical protein WBK67_02485, partial [Minisyncoccales bacterium]